MSDRVTIAAEPRTVTGKKVKQLRRQGYVPGVVYGQSEPVHVQMEEIQLRRALRVAGMTQLATLDVEGKEYIVLAREIQQHLTRRDVLHVDFMEVDMTATIRSEADLVTVGLSAVAETGEGMIAQSMYSVEIECLPDALVSQIEVDLALIATPTDSIYISDLDVPEGVTILADDDALVARFQTIRATLEEEEEGEEEEMEELDADAVEVISKESEEEF
ncbi:MAG: 50S ribosomal protein L25 [Chloroflexi bacterium]|jgi:large subunit ribosomal protein L25|nr:50S ribosomal protein L25 [Chloroflexota bacterium]